MHRKLRSALIDARSSASSVYLIPINILAGALKCERVLLETSLSALLASSVDKSALVRTVTS